MKKDTRVSLEVALTRIQDFKSALSFDKNSKAFNFSVSQQKQQSYYDQAKIQETSGRNLEKALKNYVIATKNNEKVDSCIKDFASVLHQCGFTKQAIQFLEYAKKYYRGDLNRYEKLYQTLSLQLEPTGKHQYRFLVFDLSQIKLDEEQIKLMFQKSFRIFKIDYFKDLSFSSSRTYGRYVLLQFKSFSSAKKTLQTYKRDEWFAIHKYWMDGHFHIVAEAEDGRTDFEKGFVFNKGKIIKVDGKNDLQADSKFVVPKAQGYDQKGDLELRNERTIFLINNFSRLTKNKTLQEEIKQFEENARALEKVGDDKVGDKICKDESKNWRKGDKRRQRVSVLY